MLRALKGIAFKVCCHVEGSCGACLPDCRPGACPAPPQPSYKYVSNQRTEVKATFQGFPCLLLPALHPYYLVHPDPDTLVF